MDSDRKSTVSSFYGGRKSSMDPLGADFNSPVQHYANPPTGVADRARRDSASSFYNPERASRTSMDLLSGQPRPSGGYTRETFFPGARMEPLKGGRDEEEAAGKESPWDIYADFNNAGPRYSTAFGKQDAAYQQLPAASSPKAEYDATSATTNGQVEMVTVPTMGPEWGRDELKGMTKSGRREVKSNHRREFWKRWNRNEVGLCGRWFNRKTLIWFLFALCCVIIIVLIFTIPRVPSFSFSSVTPLANATGDWALAVPVTFNRFPANFSFPAFANLQVNTHDNFLPVRFSRLHASIFDLDTTVLVATGDIRGRSLPAKSFPEIQMPLNFTYVASNDTDQTWKNWYASCRNAINYSDGKRPTVQFRLVLDMNIVGLPSTRHASTTITDAACPIELPSNSV
ncbi:hypothetical protein BDN71DRAFT_1490877 [Pleurotus eryngii]|uniref:Uncharacterized protein n=1 Tax=Pleurotus eryngii TaxID=5323 RepID=A0A9P5ZMZ7_PLEER|nr:hypothetical protein BDN71DRAFT_1490877 [Pleurotus eryngii]